MIQLIPTLYSFTAYGDSLEISATSEDRRIASSVHASVLVNKIAKPQVISVSVFVAHIKLIYVYFAAPSNKESM